MSNHERYEPDKRPTPYGFERIDKKESNWFQRKLSLDSVMMLILWVVSCGIFYGKINAQVDSMNKTIERHEVELKEHQTLIAQQAATEEKFLQFMLDVRKQ